jgi:hypothetical protein
MSFRKTDTWEDSCEDVFGISSPPSIQKVGLQPGQQFAPNKDSKITAKSTTSHPLPQKPAGHGGINTTSEIKNKREQTTSIPLQAKIKVSQILIHLNAVSLTHSHTLLFDFIRYNLVLLYRSIELL